MAAVPAQGHEHWSSRFAFLMAAVGSSVGLGNLWRFSAEAGENGGGAFVLIYLGCVLLIGIPVLAGEYIIGRSSDAASAVSSSADAARKSGASPAWSLIGWVGMIAAFMVVSFYCVVAGWVLAYIPKFAMGAFENQSPDEIAGQFNLLLEDKRQVIIFFTLFAIATSWLVSRGVNRGIEVAAKTLMPVFFVMLVGLALYGFFTGEREGALNFLFAPDFSKITWPVAAAALGQAFFSIGIGSAIMITYGSYLDHSVSIPNSAITVGLIDTSVALIAGLAIFPIVFATGLAPNTGAGLFFQTIPQAVADLPGGAVLGTAFFVLAFFAAITSSISLLEGPTSWCAEAFRLPRKVAAAIMGFAIWVVGLGAALSGEFFNLLDGVSGTILMPLSGLLGALFVGWVLDRKILAKEMSGASPAVQNGLLMLLRYVAPIAVAIILGLGVWNSYIAPALAG